jgi:hypothetical protein
VSFCGWVDYERKCCELLFWQVLAVERMRRFSVKGLMRSAGVAEIQIAPQVGLGIGNRSVIGAA